ncbi:prepilin-type N-terminal cleavage/methylation domain-containing protein [Deinococcus soli (ex Cha et al. 2016)]|uniref:Prepilin-type N-terminal cleavage/methylation domain-containing protein n=2 Tax=Deinococcus soli (ex Cha et al. 2016) TaxID=1309411 RepID=A0AAE4BMU2_9DEIO|nr:prepilin-type N-terminal cleavage/methylation domain-containing protein [Deinococcus soli (ex Cha et al. 2016)]MDR6218494.1 prepilin-type N-terminal cleavage/methylation domain-containing protein [Deinococcus soli (ex Cha et al. 2016)]MDR6329234.1 prepilin-type N-terminal cleavage/methylation domain-containing protein [Deinococcus soli (ex Cha et al. 2016)]MDR6751507.1 prepilin-type N-terminal cleavage/methylation domain-containing protein [Deinococcus soli (ex Cha et al. 2016)]
MTTPRPPTRPGRAFTLTEVLITLAILAIVAVSVVTVLTRTQQSNNIVAGQTGATGILRFIAGQVQEGRGEYAPTTGYRAFGYGALKSAFANIENGDDYGNADIYKATITNLGAVNGNSGLYKFQIQVYYRAMTESGEASIKQTVYGPKPSVPVDSTGTVTPEQGTPLPPTAQNGNLRIGEIRNPDGFTTAPPLTITGPFGFNRTVQTWAGQTFNAAPGTYTITTTSDPYYVTNIDPAGPEVRSGQTTDVNVTVTARKGTVQVVNIGAVPLTYQVYRRSGTDESVVRTGTVPGGCAAPYAECSVTHQLPANYEYKVAATPPQDQYSGKLTIVPDAYQTLTQDTTQTVTVSYAQDTARVYVELRCYTQNGTVRACAGAAPDLTTLSGPVVTHNLAVPYGPRSDFPAAPATYGFTWPEFPAIQFGDATWGRYRKTFTFSAPAGETSSYYPEMTLVQGNIRVASFTSSGVLPVTPMCTLSGGGMSKTMPCNVSYINNGGSASAISLTVKPDTYYQLNSADTLIERPYVRWRLVNRNVAAYAGWSTSIKMSLFYQRQIYNCWSETECQDGYWEWRDDDTSPVPTGEQPGVQPTPVPAPTPAPAPAPAPSPTPSLPPANPTPPGGGTIDPPYDPPPAEF